MSSKNNWLNEICSHMKWKTKPMYYWTKEKCQEVALECQSRFEFQKKYGDRSYRVSYENNWLDELCSHMKITGNIFKRLIYVCEFSDKFVYIGLTCNSERRNNEHLNDIHSSVYKHILDTGLQPIYKELTDYLDINIVGNIEKFYIEKFENLGYNILNKKEGGGLGGGYIKWTYENCKNEALKYKSKTLFCKNKGRAYRKSVKENWLNDFYTK